MKNLLKKSSPVAWFLLGVLVAGGTGTAYAANGGTFRLGQSNSATATTKLTNTKGTALKVISKAGTPPINVGTNSTKVPYFNADKLDGKDSTAFQPAGKMFYAVVDAESNPGTPTLVRGSAGTSILSGASGDGFVVVRFNRNVTNCSYTATLGQIGSSGSAAPGFVTTAGAGADVNGVYLQTSNSSGSQTARDVHLHVLCP